METSDYSEFEQSYLLQLGKIVFAVGYIEQNTTLFLARLSGNMKLGANLGFGRLMDKVYFALNAIFYSQKRDEKLKIVFKYLLTEIDRIEGERNKNFHCKWEFDTEHKIAQRVKLGKPSEGQLKHPDWADHVELAELIKIEKDAWQFNYDLHTFDLALALQPFPPPFPPKERDFFGHDS